VQMGRLWTMDSTTGEEAMRYEGAQQAEFVIRSCFGGAGENFVISGSEGEFHAGLGSVETSTDIQILTDSHVYIWRRQTGAPVAEFEAHSPGIVNAVAWHPTNPSIFASAGDDRRVRM
jgi:WD40 repeat protein